MPNFKCPHCLEGVLDLGCLSEPHSAPCRPCNGVGIKVDRARAGLADPVGWAREQMAPIWAEIDSTLKDRPRRFVPAPRLL